MTEIWLTSLDGTLTRPLYSIGPYGSYGDLQITTRWGDGACGMYEAQWSMPLPNDYDHPLLRRGTMVTAKDAAWQFGSQLVLSEPGRGTGFDDPWMLKATGVGREVEGQDSWFCDDGSGNATTVMSAAVDSAIVNGLKWSGRDATVPTTAFGPFATSQQLNTIGSLASAYADATNQRWLVDGTGTLGFHADPSTPSYRVTPGAALLGTADDDYATVVKLRYYDSATGTYKTAISPASPSAVQTRFGRREYAEDVTSLGPISAATAQTWADGILAKAKGRLAWTGSMSVTAQELQTMTGRDGCMTKVLEDVSNGCMVRLDGIWSDLLESNGQMYTDVVIGEARWTDGSPTVDLAPMGLAKRDLASIFESITGMAAAA